MVQPEVVRGAVVRTLGAPASAFWRIDVPPLPRQSSTNGPGGRWNLRLGQPLGQSTTDAGRPPEAS
ncbi:hypothetical protein [Streptomyces europaeiscabiei]|uniref:hypothetical protein n=1 Tax=Streptomyces europaeiscabiei TaxID=146819 RepID=UPI0029CA88E1|nr:hypothetical protein [Streptomyces europaeiscabiei]